MSPNNERELAHVDINFSAFLIRIYIARHMRTCERARKTGVALAGQTCIIKTLLEIIKNVKEV